MFVRLFAFVGVLAVLAGAPQLLAAQEQITVFAAASLKNALDDTNAAFTKATGVKITASYAASSALAKQIEQGAPADVFISADLQWMDYASGRKLIKADTRVNLLGNKLVLIAPADSKIANVAIGHGFDIAKLAGASRMPKPRLRNWVLGRQPSRSLRRRRMSGRRLLSSRAMKRRSASSTKRTQRLNPR
jgi:molybdate transport system substrate-binding protein